MVKYTPEDNRDYDQINLALNKIKTITDFVNDNKRKAENLQKIISIQSSIHGSIRVCLLRIDNLQLYIYIPLPLLPTHISFLFVIYFISIVAVPFE